MPAQLPSNNAVVPFPVEPKTTNLNAMKILVIDDDATNVALVEAMLVDAGYTNIKCITDSRSAFETCQNFQPDLILLDLMMPHVDGFAVLDFLKVEVGENSPPVIVLTADTNSESRLRAMRGGATDFLLKPLDYSEVLLRVANILEARRLKQVVDTERAATASARAHANELRSTLWELENSRSIHVVPLARVRRHKIRSSRISTPH